MPALEVGLPAFVLAARRHDHHLVGGHHLGSHLGQLELDRLVLRDGLAERLPLLSVADGQLEGAVRDPAGPAATLTRPTSIPSIIW
jgi:hypothetical protein